MRRRDSLRAACLAVLAAAALAAPAARAASGSLFFQQICADMNSIPGMYGFETDFVGVANCQKLCQQAVVSCQKAVKDAATCQLAFSSDWIAFDTKVACKDLTGADLSDCKASWSDDKKNWQFTIKLQRQFAVNSCVQHLQICELRCTGQ